MKKWIIWVSIVLLSLIGIFAIGAGLFSLLGIGNAPIATVGALVGNAIIFFFMSYVPVTELYKKVKQK